MSRLLTLTNLNRRARAGAGWAALAASLLLAISHASPAHAAPPQVAVFQLKNGQYQLVGSVLEWSGCFDTISLAVYAVDPDGRGLGYPVFEDFGVHTPVSFIWTIPYSNVLPDLAYFSPTITFVPLTERQWIVLEVYDKDKERTAKAVSIQLVPLPGRQTCF